MAPNIQLYILKNMSEVFSPKHLKNERTADVIHEWHIATNQKETGRGTLPISAFFQPTLITWQFGN